MDKLWVPISLISCRSLRQQAQCLAPCGNRRGQLYAAARRLPFGLGGFGFDAQPCRKIGLAQAEGFVEESARLTSQGGAAFRGCKLRACRIDPDLCGLPLRLQPRTIQRELGLCFHSIGPSSRHLALIEWASALKLFNYACIGFALFVPWGVARDLDSPQVLALALVVLCAKLLVCGAVLALIETLNAKIRIFRAPEFLALAFMLAVLGLLVRLLLQS